MPQPTQYTRTFVHQVITQPILHTNFKRCKPPKNWERLTSDPKMITMKNDLDGDGITDYAFCSKDPAKTTRCCYPGMGSRCEEIDARLGTVQSYNGCDKIESTTDPKTRKMHIPPGLLLSAPQVFYCRTYVSACMHRVCMYAPSCKWVHAGRMLVCDHMNTPSVAGFCRSRRLLVHGAMLWLVGLFMPLFYDELFLHWWTHLPRASFLGMLTTY